MSGYPNSPYGQGPYGQPSGHSQPPGQGPYGQPSGHSQPPGQGPYGQPSGHSQPPGQGPHSQPPGQGPYGQPSGHSQPPGQAQAYPPASYPAPYGSQAVFPPGTDPEIIRCFQMSDQDGSGLIDDKELQRVLSSSNQSFSLRTVHLLMYMFTNNSSHKIGPKEFTSLWYSLQAWRTIFERFDRDRSGKIDSTELRDALLSLGYVVTPSILQILVSKYDKTGQGKAIDYDNFIECSLVVKGLTDKFKEKDTGYTGSATLSYETFMLIVLPFIVA